MQSRGVERCNICRPTSRLQSKKVEVYDYVDSSFRMLARVFEKRSRAFKAVGYSVHLRLWRLANEAEPDIFDDRKYPQGGSFLDLFGPTLRPLETSQERSPTKNQ